MIDKLVKDIPSKVKYWTFVLFLASLPIWMPATCANLYPPNAVKPVQEQVDALSKRVDNMERNQNDQYARIERYLCLADRTKAELSGMSCTSITPTR